MDIRCPHCSTAFTWHRSACPRCWRGNGLRPAMLALKFLALALICVVITLVLKLAIVSTVNEPIPSDDPSRDKSSPNRTNEPQPGAAFAEQP